MRIAYLSVERLSLQERLRLLGTSATDLWSKLPPPREVPKAASDLDNIYIDKVEELRKKATDDYQTAADSYSKAVKSAEKIHKWVYQGQLAAAYMGLYRLSGDTKELKNAAKAIEDALEGKESSPHLEPVRQLRRLVRASQGRPPTTPAPKAPSTAPASTAPSTGL